MDGRLAIFQIQDDLSFKLKYCIQGLDFSIHPNLNDDTKFPT